VFNAHSLARWMEVWDTEQTMRAEAESLNLDKAAVLMRLFSAIGDAARRARHTRRS